MHDLNEQFLQGNYLEQNVWSNVLELKELNQNKINEICKKKKIIKTPHCQKLLHSNSKDNKETSGENDVLKCDLKNYSPLQLTFLSCFFIIQN